MARSPVPISQVRVRVPQPGRHAYSYEEECSSGPLGRFAVGASYDVASQEAREMLKAVSGAWAANATWSCPDDPWGTDRRPCRNT